MEDLAANYPWLAGVGAAVVAVVTIVGTGVALALLLVVAFRFTPRLMFGRPKNHLMIVTHRRGTDTIVRPNTDITGAFALTSRRKARWIFGLLMIKDHPSE